MPQATPTPPNRVHAVVTITSNIAITISPSSSSVELGSTQIFHASTNSKGHPDPTVHWSLITAISAADPSKQNSASITVTGNFTLQVSAPTSMAIGVTTAIVANMTVVPGSHPSGALSWSLSGTGCSGNA